MPFVEIRGYLFGFFVAEPRNEPAHIHVKGKGGTAKVWLQPARLARTSYSEGQTREILQVVEEQEIRFMEMWLERSSDR